MCHNFLKIRNAEPITSFEDLLKDNSFSEAFRPCPKEASASKESTETSSRPATAWEWLYEGFSLIAKIFPKLSKHIHFGDTSNAEDLLQNFSEVPKDGTRSRYLIRLVWSKVGWISFSSYNHRGK
jgi:hypothetical protein